MLHIFPSFQPFYLFGGCKKGYKVKKKAVLSMVSPKINRSIYAIGSMYAIYGNIYHTISPMLAYIAAPWILWVCSHRSFPLVPT